MANYLITHYKGKYRIKAPIDLSTNTFARKLDDTFEDIDCYIDCYQNVQISYYGKKLLECYIPSLGRGRNIVKTIKKELGEDIILYLNETDSEVIFRFHAKHMGQLEKYLKPKTSGSDISPFSSRNIPKTDYIIPDEDLDMYKQLIENIPQNQRIELAHITKNFLKTLVTKQCTWENIKADMTLKGLKQRDYIHSVGKWNDYIKYLEKHLCRI